jgi:hypothetical protein
MGRKGKGGGEVDAGRRMKIGATSSKYRIFCDVA